MWPLQQCSELDNEGILCGCFKASFQSFELSYVPPATLRSFLGCLSCRGWLQPSDRGRKVKIAQDTMARIGNQLLSESKAAITQSEKEGGKSTTDGHDLLSLLVRANTSTELPASQRLSDKDVLARELLCTLIQPLCVHMPRTTQKYQLC